MDRLVDELFVHLRERGYKARMVSIKNLHLLQKEIDGLREQGLFNNEFYQDRLDWFRFQVPESLPKTQSVIVVAVPRPQTRATFMWNGHRRQLIIPPTYTAYDGIRGQVGDLLAKILGEKGYVPAGTALHLKLLAVRSGLGQYGRNNVCYVSGMGSFLQLVAIYSDVPCEEDDWQEVTMMKSCEGCELCRRACPTGAIPSDRFFCGRSDALFITMRKKGVFHFPSGWMLLGTTAS